MKEIQDILNELLETVQGHPLGDDSKRVVDADALQNVREWLKHSSIGAAIIE